MDKTVTELLLKSEGGKNRDIMIFLFLMVEVPASKAKKLEFWLTEALVKRVLVCRISKVKTLNFIFSSTTMKIQLEHYQLLS